MAKQHFTHHPEFQRVSAMVAELMVGIEEDLAVADALNSFAMERQADRACDEMTKLFLRAIDRTNGSLR